MARLTDEEISAGKKSYLNVDNNQAVLHLTEDFKIEYVHNVTETVNNPQPVSPKPWWFGSNLASGRRLLGL